MNEPWLKIKGFRGFDYSNAVECDEYQKRLFVTELLKSVEDGQLYAEATTCSTGDTMYLLIKNKRTGQHEIYECQVRAHYMQDGEFPIPGAGKVVKSGE